MYLRVSDQQYLANIDPNNDVTLYYTNLDLVDSKNITIVIQPYVCLFDDEWKIVEEVWEYLQSRLNVKRLTFNTVATKGSDLKIYYDFLSQYKIDFSSPTHKTINDFIAWLMQNNKAQKNIQLNIESTRTSKTINRIVSTVKDFYKYHEVINHIENPFKHSNETIKRPVGQNKSFYQHTQKGHVQKSAFKIKEFDKGIRILTKEQIETVLNACTMQRDKLLFELLLFTGMRIGEALSLDIHSIGVVHVTSNVQEIKMNSNSHDVYKGNRYRQQKTGIRDLFIPTKLMKKLSEYYENVWLKIYANKEMSHEYFFISEFHNNLGEPLSYQAVWDRCRKIGKETGIYFTPHDFRHTYATTLARNQVGIEKLRKLLGHSHIGSTDLYIQIANKEKIVEELIPFYESYGVIDD